MLVGPSIRPSQIFFNSEVPDFRVFLFFSRGHATLHLAMSVGMSVVPSVRHILEFQAVFALLLLPNRPRLDCRVSGLVVVSFFFRF